jgi:hypothetical protein
MRSPRLVRSTSGPTERRHCVTERLDTSRGANGVERPLAQEGIAQARALRFDGEGQQALDVVAAARARHEERGPCQEHGGEQEQHRDCRLEADE